MRDTNTDEVEVLFMSISERGKYLEDHPHMKQDVSSPPLGDAIRLRITKNPDSFKDVLRNIKKHHHGSNIDV